MKAMTSSVLQIGDVPTIKNQNQYTMNPEIISEPFGHAAFRIRDKPGQYFHILPRINYLVTSGEILVLVPDLSNQALPCNT